MSAPMERLHKLLAHAGFGSRRACEELVLSGRVTVDGVVVRTLGSAADLATQEVRCDGEVVRTEPKVYFLLNKPRGYVCTNDDPQGRPRVIDLLRGVCQRIYTVGRLDEDSDGLIVVSNDGELTNLLTHPRYGVAKTYRVVVKGYVSGEQLERIQKGVWLAEGRTSPLRVKVHKRSRDMTAMDVTLREGMNREVRRIFARIGHPVRSLTRIRIGGLVLGSLGAGEFRAISREQVLAAMQAPEPRERRKRPHPKPRRGKTAE